MQMIIRVRDTFLKVFGKDSGALLFLTSIASYYGSLFNKIGISIDNPIAVICHDESEFARLINLIRNDTNEIIPLEMEHEELKAAIDTIQDDYVGFMARASAKAKRGLSLVENYLNAGMMRKVVAMVGFINTLTEKRDANYIVAEFPPETAYSPYCKVIVEWQKYLCDFMIDEGQLGLRFIKDREECHREYGWLYASALLADYMARINNETEEGSFLEILCDDIERIVEYSENLQEDFGITNMASEYLYRFAMESGIKMILITDYEYIPADVYSATYYDDNFYYIPDELMKKAMEPLYGTVKLPQILGAYAMEGTLLTSTDGLKTKFTRKVPIIKANGIPERFRFHMLKRDGIDREYGSQLVDTFRKGE